MPNFKVKSFNDSKRFWIDNLESKSRSRSQSYVRPLVIMSQTSQQPSPWVVSKCLVKRMYYLEKDISRKYLYHIDISIDISLNKTFTHLLTTQGSSYLSIMDEFFKQVLILHRFMDKSLLHIQWHQKATKVHINTSIFDSDYISSVNFRPKLIDQIGPRLSSSSVSPSWASSTWSGRGAAGTRRRVRPNRPGAKSPTADR